MGKTVQEAQVMICLICRQGEIQDGFTSIELQRGDIYLMITHVPARVCLNCDEAYVEQEVAVRLLQSAEDTLDAGILDTQYEYSAE